MEAVSTPIRTAPTLDEEHSIMALGFQTLGAIDEVGRGAIAGPATVGVVVINATVRTAPAGVRDSKQLSALQRRALVPVILAWAVDSAVGHASAEVVDEIGIIAALAHAAKQALRRLTVRPDVILLDGSHDWLGAHGIDDVPIITKVRADATCAAVGAASVLAKVQRDDLMIEMAQQFPRYGWEANKGYASARHMEAVREFGACIQHRRSWNLPIRQETLRAI